MHKPVVSTMLSKALEENPVAYRGRQHNLNTFDFEAHNLPPILHYLYGQKELFEIFTAIHLVMESSMLGERELSMLISKRRFSHD
jgi:hypothetical protein